MAEKVVVVKRETGIKYVKYVCTKCGAEDEAKIYNGEATPLALNCWKCHSGYGVQMQQMIAGRIGMLQVQPTKEMK